MDVRSAAKDGCVAMRWGTIFTQESHATFFKRHVLFMKIDQLIHANLISAIGLLLMIFRCGCDRICQSLLLQKEFTKK